MNRSEINDKYKWDLSAIVKSEEEWGDIYTSSSKLIEKIADYVGKLNNRESILNCLNDRNYVSSYIERLYVYAKMKLDENSTLSKYQALTDKAERLLVNMSTVTSFITPELNLVNDEELRAMSECDEFSDHSCFLEDIIKSKKYILTDKEERILSECGSFADGFHDAFNMFDNADVDFGMIKFEGKNMHLTHGSYSLVMQSDDRAARKKAFGMMFGQYKQMINTITTLYAGNVKKDCFYSRVRGYDSALDRAMFNENVPSSIYDNLVKSVDKSLGQLHKYVAYRKKALGLKTMHMWDMHTSLVTGESMSFEYEDALTLVKEALVPLGDDYRQLLDRAFSEKWIDVYENKGKRSGAYSWGSYNAHPYVLLNYTKTTHDIFTIAHELGHAMHSYYSNTSLPYAKAGYEIFVAEVASTVNEVLLLKHLISKATGENKKYLLCYYLDMFRTTLFRQTQFAEFEAIAHGIYESGESLTAEVLCDEYQALNERYYGKSVKSDEMIKYEWARIPHFYRSFYVYKYATGITSAVVIATNILKDSKNVESYKKFLSLGGSMPPAEILKVAGVDLEKPETFDIAMAEFNATLDELKKMS